MPRSDTFIATLLLLLGAVVSAAIAQDAGESPRTLPEVVATSRQAELLERINKTLAEPAADLDEPAQRDRLDRLISDATRLTLVTEPGELHVHALSIQMQALYQRITRFPADPGADRMLSELRAAARRTRSLQIGEAPAVGDFWLMTADLYDINRLSLPAEARRQRARELLEAHMQRFPDGATAAAARAALAQLSTGESGENPAEPAPGAANAAATIDPPDPDRPAAADRAREALAQLNEPPFALGDRRVDAQTGVVSIEIRSRYQPGANTLRILEPATLAGDRKSLDVLFVLPVQAGDGADFGDGFEVIRKLDLHNRYGLLVVAPTLAQTPWFADHPADPTLWQESYFVKAVVPAIDTLYPAEQTRRLLLGFSKSGWGAVSLLVRWPDRFEAAAAWDAPLMVADVGNFEMAGVFGDDRNFARYELNKRFADKARLLRRKPRIALLGYDVFREHHQRAHALLEQLRIPHTYADGPHRRHHWNSGWVGEAVEALVKLAATAPTGE